MKILLSALILLAGSVLVPAQQLRDVVRKVDASVVVVKTVEKNVLRAPQPVFVSSPGLGSGVLISADGKVLTAAHVVQAADKVEVEFVDGQVVPAKVVASMPRADIALLKLDWVPYNARPATLGDSDKMQVGDDVFIIGAPYGISHTLSVGHVSARRGSKVSFGGVSLEMLQTDAAINKGNSGGPVFSLAGEVVAIVSHIFSQSGGSEGLGFAITTNVAQKLLIDGKGFWTGVDGLLLSDEWIRIFNVPQKAGFLVQRVADNSPAFRIGLLGGTYPSTIAGTELLVGGDIILEVCGMPVSADGSNSIQMFDHLSKLNAGDPVSVKVLRGGQVTELKGFAPAK
jgi:serine protease Do